MTGYNDLLLAERERRFEWGCRLGGLAIVLVGVLVSVALSVWLAW